MKLFATDLDGTLIKGKHLSEENLIAINKLKEKNKILAISTGRSLNGCDFLMKEYKLKPDYLVLLNGALIIDKDKKVVHHKEIPFAILKKIIETSIKDDDNVVISTESGYTTYLIHGQYEDPEMLYEMQDATLEDIENERLSLISLSYPKLSIEEVDDICKDINAKYGEIVVAYRNTVFIDVVPKGCSKGEGIEYIKEKEDIDTKDTYSIGDSWNDISMFKVSGSSFTFHGVEEGIKEEANHVVSSVAEAVNLYCLVE